MTNAKDAADGKAGRASPDPPSAPQTRFDRFVDFARRVIAVPRSEIEDQERLYKKRRERKQR